MTLYFARHGQTEWNLAGRWQGQLDSPLTGLGVQQAQRHAEFFVNLHLDGVYASPLGRARRTAEVIAQRTGSPLFIVEGLAELSYGEWAGLTHAEALERFPNELALRNRERYTFRFPGGESYQDASARAHAALADILSAGHTRALVVSHEMIGRTLLKHALHLSPDEALQLHHPHDVVYRVDGRREVAHSSGGAAFTPGWPDEAVRT